MDISVIVSTRDRGNQVLPAVQSILRNEGCQWSLLIVDQSRTASMWAYFMKRQQARMASAG